ncbi:VOC family protein [Salinicola endophyticus]|uniref:VOC family protein n=1 Tax=Salinicola endophyticus TaxID=1949083 RepID=A0AB74UCS9_9GAMM
MRWRGINHLELSVIDYEASVAFYDRLFGWLGYTSFWTLDIGYRSTYYMARFPLPHSYIGLQPAQSGGKLDHAARATGIHHVALWAASRREIVRFHREFLLPQGIPVSEPPAEYAVYAPGYYAVFFDDPINGIHWELAHIPRLPTPMAYLRWRRAMQAALAGSARGPRDTLRRLPGRG